MQLDLDKIMYHVIHNDIFQERFKHSNSVHVLHEQKQQPCRHVSDHEIISRGETRVDMAVDFCSCITCTMLYIWIDIN